MSAELLSGLLLTPFLCLKQELLPGSAECVYMASLQPLVPRKEKWLRNY